MAATKYRLRRAIDSLYTHGPATHECYTRLALECFRANDVDQAKRLETHMDFHLYQPSDSFLQNRLLHLYAKLGKISHARYLFDKMSYRDIFSWNAMLSLYAKAGLVEDLRVVFDDMPSRDSVSYNTVITGFAKNGRAGKAVEAFVRMQTEGFKPTEYTHVSVLNACTQLLDLRKGKQIHGRILTGNYLGGNVFIWNALTDMYAKCKEIDQARWLFDRLANKNMVSWNSMISGYLKNGQFEIGINLFHEMQGLGLKPDQVTVSNVLCAYFQSGYIDGATKLFSETREKDKVCWTTMIVGYTQNGKEENALMLFNEMLENVRPDSYTISSVVSSCAKLASLIHGQVIHGIALLMGIDDDLLVSTSLVDMYCKCGVTSDAWVVFSMMPARSVVSWNAMLGGYARNGQDLEALALYEKMFQENIRPDNITFVGVLSACNHAGLFDEGKKHFDSMSKVHALEPTLDHFACMINLLGRSGCLDKAINLINTMPHEPNCLIWSTVLSISALKSDIEHGEMAARHLFELDPLNAGPYITLSNMYAACGRWKDVASVRSLMKTNNVKKFAAYSWIEIDNEVHKFVADDRTHPDTKLIYEELNGLIRKLQKAGFSPNTNLVLHDVGEEEKRESISYHSEKLALAFGLMKKYHGPIRIIKNIRVCGDCHVFMKFVSEITGRQVILRDSNRFHHFVAGKCSCNDYW
eukprot:XP_015579068.1 pentatricopeptide repeat-containing protein At4g02750 [Ricinus communis]